LRWDIVAHILHGVESVDVVITPHLT